jgi:hypothetical protein
MIFHRALIASLLLILPVLHAAELPEGELFGFRIGDTYTPADGDRLQLTLGVMDAIAVGPLSVPDDYEAATVLVTPRSRTIIGISARAYSSDRDSAYAQANKYFAMMRARFADLPMQETETGLSSAPFNHQIVVQLADRMEYRAGIKEMMSVPGKFTYLFAVGLIADGAYRRQLHDKAAGESGQQDPKIDIEKNLRKYEQSKSI